MPASSNDFTSSHDPLEASLRASLGIKDNLDHQIAASSLKKVLFQKIDFVEAEKTAIHQLDKLKSKYVFLNGQKEVKKGATDEFQKPMDVKSKMTVSGSDSAASSKSGPIINGASAVSGQESEHTWNRDENFPRAKLVLYKAELDTSWRKWSKIGAGLHNMGNTCFLNSVLQCLTYTVPLTNYLMSNDHQQICRIGGFCMMCELQRHIRRCFENSNQAIRPQPIISRLKNIAKHMQWGRQEDAHEFLRYVVEAMIKSCLDGYAKLDPVSKATTVVNKIFSGYLRSQVQCCQCTARSDTYDPFLDISLDIKNVATVESALHKFVAPDTLDGDNSYDCPRCRRSCPATKRFTIHKPSTVLTIQLKRFDYNRSFGGKVSRHIGFRDKLDVRPFMSVKKGDPVLYQLYAVLVHSGMGCNSGHYYCYVRAPNNTWYCMNDAHVSPCSLERLLQTEAYLLFYIRTTSNHQQFVKKPVAAAAAAASTKPRPLANGNISRLLGEPCNELGSAVPRRAPAVALSSPLPNQREKIVFDIRPKSAPTTNLTTAHSKPRILMNIKRSHNGYQVNAQSGSSASSANPFVVSKAALSVHRTKPTNLVPEYNGDDSDSDRSEKLHRTPDKPPVAAANPDANRSSAPSACKAVSAVNIPLPSAPTEAPGPVKAPDTTSKSMSAPLENSPLKPRLTIKHPTKTKLGSDAALSLNTSVSGLNATSPWSVVNKDCAISPSVGSESSNTSINSTTEWKIQDRRDGATAPLVPECQHSGWTVEETPKDATVNVIKPLILKKCKEENGLSPSADDRAEIISTDASKRHKKHKKRKHSDTELFNVDLKRSKSDDGDDVKAKARRLSKESASSSQERKKKKKKNKHKHRDDKRHTEHRNRKSSESEYEWVEKTKETITLPLEAPVQKWDQHSQKRERGAGDSADARTAPIQTAARWDGQRRSDVVNDLESMFSNQGYGSSVLSWNGEMNSQDRLVQDERRLDRHKSWEDHYEEEFDKGKSKKYKENRQSSESALYRAGHNPFQTAQDMKSARKHDKDAYRPQKSSYHHDDHHHHQQHRHHRQTTPTHHQTTPNHHQQPRRHYKTH